MKASPARGLVLLLPAMAAFTFLVVLPFGNIVDESFKYFEPGRVGSVEGAPYTLANYAELFSTTYFRYFFSTFRIGLVASLICLVVAFPMAYVVARMRSGFSRKLAIGFLVAFMFLSGLVRVYSLELTLGSVGVVGPLLRLFEILPSSRTYVEAVVIAGLLHFIIPLSALILVSSIQNVNPRLVDAAMALGSPRWKAHLTVTLPLNISGILSAFLISYCLCISAFIVPQILGRGKVLFVSNLIFNRVNEVLDYPGGSALSVLLLLVSLLIVYATSRFAGRPWQGAR